MGKEIGIFGAGVAGLNAAVELTNRGHQVEVITPDQPDAYRSVYTVLDLDTVSPLSVRNVSGFRMATNQGVDFTLTPRNRCGMVDYPGFLFEMKQRAKLNIEKLPGRELSKIQIVEDREKVHVRLPGGERSYDAVIDATGVGAIICRQVEPARGKENPLVEYVYGGVFVGNIDPEAMVIVVGPAGGTCWASPSILGKGWIDIVYSAWGWQGDFGRFLGVADGGLETLISFMGKLPGVVIEKQRPEEIFSGMIRSCPIPLPESKKIYPYGESAGFARPGTGDCFRRILMASEQLADAVEKGVSPQDYLKEWRKSWKRDRFYLSSTLARLGHQLKGNLGEVTKAAYQLYGNGKLTRLTNDIERFFLDGEIGFRLYLLMLGRLEFRRYLLNSAYFSLKRWDRVEPFWTLPEE